MAQRWLSMQLDAPGRPLQQVWREALPVPGPGQVRLRVRACGVCRTDLHIVDGELAHPGTPVVPGHEVVGTVSALGDGVDGLAPGERVGVPHVGRRLSLLGQPGGQPAPQLRLPGQVGREWPVTAVGVAAGMPVGEQLWALHGVAGEQTGESPGHREASPPPQLGLLLAVRGDRGVGCARRVPEVTGQRQRPGLVDAVVERGQQWPGQRFRCPGVVVVGRHGRAQRLDQRPRAAELHARADAVLPPRASTEPVPEPLAEPPLDALGRHHHQLCGERVVRGGREQVGEAVGQPVGARGAVEVERHSSRP